MGFTFRRATREHAERVGRMIRDSDRAELAALGFTDPAARLLEALDFPGDHRALVDEDTGEALALLGVGEINETTGSPWMVCASDVSRGRRFLLKRGRRFVRAWAKLYPTLLNASDARNRMHHRFIEWCGFSWLGETSINGFAFRVFAYV